MNERYKAVEGSKTAHCCFEATVVDTLAPPLDDSALVCECFDMESAQKIADALNAAHYEQQEKSHDWDDQDKCRRCGDRDWYASATCTPKQQEKTMWQPIETAPKDGTVILGWDGYTQTTIEWWKSGRYWSLCAGAWTEDSEWFPTHWYPLQSPPTLPSTKCPGIGCPAHYANDSPPLPDVSALVEALEEGFPLFDEDGLDADIHHCEWNILQERKRLHSIIAKFRSQGGEL